MVTVVRGSIDIPPSGGIQADAQCDPDKPQREAEKPEMSRMRGLSWLITLMVAMTLASHFGL